MCCGLSRVSALASRPFCHRTVSVRDGLSFLSSCISQIAYVQGVRGLLLIAMSLGFVAAVLCFIGMDCTYIGGSEKTKDRVLFFGVAFHFVGGEQNHLSSIYTLYNHTHLTYIYTQI